MVSLVALALAFMVTTPEGKVTIDWEASPGCPVAADFRYTVNRYLSAELDAYGRALEVVALLQPDVGGHHLDLHIRIDGVSEGYELSNIDCEQLGRDAALLVASALDPFARGPAPGEDVPRQITPPPSHPPSPPPSHPVTRDPVVQIPRRVVVDAAASKARTPEPREPSQPPQPPQPPQPVEWSSFDLPERDREPRRADGPRPPVRALFDTSALGFAGVFPGVGGGVSTSVGLERGRLRWQLGADGWFGGRFRPEPGFGANLWALTGVTRLCVVPSLARVRFPLCAQVGVGAMTASTVGAARPGRNTQPWVQGGLAVRASWMLRARAGAGASLFVGVALLPNLSRPSWMLVDPNATFTVAPVGGLLQLGVELGGVGAGVGPAIRSASMTRSHPIIRWRTDT